MIFSLQALSNLIGVIEIVCSAYRAAAVVSKILLMGSIGAIIHLRAHGEFSSSDTGRLQFSHGVPLLGDAANS